jgi:hypothetical protein
MKAIIFNKDVDSAGNDCYRLCVKGKVHIHIVSVQTGYDQEPDACRISSVKYCDGSCVTKEVELLQEFVTAVRAFLESGERAVTESMKEVVVSDSFLR